MKCATSAVRSFLRLRRLEECRAPLVLPAPLARLRLRVLPVPQPPLRHQAPPAPQPPLRHQAPPAPLALRSRRLLNSRFPERGCGRFRGPRAAFCAHIRNALQRPSCSVHRNWAFWESLCRSIRLVLRTGSQLVRPEGRKAEKPEGRKTGRLGNRRLLSTKCCNRGLRDSRQERFCLLAAKERITYGLGFSYCRNDRRHFFRRLA